MPHVTAQQFANEVGLSLYRVQELARTGRLPAVRPGNSGRWRIDMDLALKRWRRPQAYERQYSRASACVATICTGNERAALHQYRQLPNDLRARVDAWCAKKGIDSPGLKLKQMQAKRPAVVLDMTAEGAD